MRTIYDNKLEERIESLEVIVKSLVTATKNQFHTSLPEPNTYDEWKMFARLWIDGAELQWFDRSPDADHEWFDFTSEDPWYPYDENLVIRVKTIEKERR